MPSLRSPLSPADNASSADPLAPLVSQMAQGDERALVALYDATVGSLFSLAARIVRDPHIAEEVVEDTLFTAWRDATRYDTTRGRVMTWLMMMCRSRALDALRKVDSNESLSDVEDQLAGISSNDESADAMLDAFRMNSAVRAAVEALPSAERQAIALSFFRGLTHQDIADLWNMPLGSVKTIMNRAFTQLRSSCALHWNEFNES